MTERFNYYRLLPTELEISLSNECNLACRYCYYRNNDEPPQTLKWGDLKKGIDIWLFHTAPDKVKNLGTDISHVRKIDFAGREPLLQYQLLETAVDYIRKKAGRTVEIGICTNGTLLTREMVSRLRERNVEIALSLDGPKEINDINRVFKDYPEKSVFDAVISNLRLLPPGALSEMIVSVTLTSETVHSMSEGFSYLLGLGFGKVSLGLEMFEVWTEKGMGKLCFSLEKLKKRLNKFLDSGNFPYSSTQIFPVDLSDTRCRRMPVVTDEIALGYDGRFYPCTVPALGVSSGRAKYSIGSVRTGLDFKNFHRQMSAIDLKLKKYDVAVCTQCPVGGYFDCRLERKKLSALFESSRKVSSVFNRKTGGILTVDRALNFAALNGKLGTPDRKPCHVIGKKINRLMIDCKAETNRGEGGSLVLSEMIEGVDMLLYSTGRRKVLMLDVGVAGRNFDEFIAVAVYAMIRAAKLNKKLHLIAMAHAEGADRVFFRFLSEHGISCWLRGWQALGKSHLSRVIGSDTAGGIVAIIRPCGAEAGALFKKALKSGFRAVRFEIDSNSAPWKAGDLKRLETGLRSVRNDLSRRLKRGEQIFIENLAPVFDKGYREYDCPLSNCVELSGDGYYRYGSLYACGRPVDGHCRLGQTGSGIESKYLSCAFDSGAAACRMCLVWKKEDSAAVRQLKDFVYKTAKMILKSGSPCKAGQSYAKSRGNSPGYMEFMRRQEKCSQLFQQMARK